MNVTRILCACLAMLSLTGVSCREKTAPVPESVAVAPVDLRIYGNHIMVLGHENRRLMLIDPASGNVVKSIALAQAPNGMAVDGTTAYVAEGGPCGVIEVIDMEKGAVKGTFPAGHTPMAPIVRGGRLYAANRFDSNVIEMDAETGKMLNIFPASREPVALAASPDGSRIWAANLLPSGAADGDAAASELTLIENGKTTNLPLANGTQSVRGMAISPDGKYLVLAHVLSRYQVPTTQLDRGWISLV